MRITFRRWLRTFRSTAHLLATALTVSAETLVRAAAASAGYTADQIAKATELIEDNAIHLLRGRVWLAVSTDGQRVHRVATSGQCSCPAGVRGSRCFHVLAAITLANA